MAGMDFRPTACRHCALGAEIFEQGHARIVRPALGKQCALVVKRACGSVASGDLGIGARQDLPQSQHLLQDRVLLAVRWQGLAGIAACALVLAAGDGLACSLQHLQVLVGRRRGELQSLGDLQQRRVRACGVYRMQLLQQIETGCRIGEIHS